VADLYPKLNLLGLASFAGNSVDGLVASDHLQSIAAGLVTVPIFNAGKTHAQIREAREEETQALLTYRKTILESFRDVEDALARYKAEDDRRASLAQAVEASANSLTIAEAQYRAGTVTFINVLNAENALLQTRDQLTQSNAQTLSDLVSLYKALGGGWSVGAGG
jgi:outer membrane protein TolC